jgi:superfamily II DNA helicase RecQ
MLLKAKAVQIENLQSKAVYKALQQVLGKQDISFQSVEQEPALYAVLDNQTPLIIVLPTGGGKSLLFTLPAIIKKKGVIVIVIPYQALIKDLVSQIQEYRVDCIE